MVNPLKSYQGKVGRGHMGGVYGRCSETKEKKKSMNFERKQKKEKILEDRRGEF